MILMTLGAGLVWGLFLSEINDFWGQVLGLFLSETNYISGTGWGLFLTAMNNFWGMLGFAFNCCE